MARTMQTSRKSTSGKTPRKQLAFKGSKVRQPVASEYSQEPKTEDATEVAKASIELTFKDIRNFLKKTGNTETSASVSAGGIQWQLRVETSALGHYGRRVQLGCSLEGALADGAWSRWLTADFFVFDQKDWRKLGGVCEKLVGSAPLPCRAGEPRLVSAQKMRYGRFSYVARHRDSAKFRVDFACWKDSFEEKGAFDDVNFVVQGRPVYSNRGYMAYISPVLHTMLYGHFKEAQSDTVPITQTSAEDFITFMRAVAPYRDQLSDANVQVLYGLADVYDVEFLRRDCEKHLMATKGIEAIDKLLLAQSLNKTEFITRLVDSLSEADLKKFQDHDLEEELSEEVKDQLREREKLLTEMEHSSDSSF